MPAIPAIDREHREAIGRTLELNGAAVALNKRAFVWGRIVASDPAALVRIDDRQERVPTQDEMSLDELVRHRAEEPAAYQDAAYAERWTGIVAHARAAERKAIPGSEEFARAVAIGAHRLMACKAEYEVARLYAASEFKASLAAQFSTTEKLSVWLTPPLLSRTDPATGRPKKRKFGPCVFKVMAMPAALRSLRGCLADPFGHTRERRTERAIAAEFLADMMQLGEWLSASSYERAVALARLSQVARGFGPVKETAMATSVERRAALRDAPMVIPANAVGQAMKRPGEPDVRPCVRRLDLGRTRLASTMGQAKIVAWGIVPDVCE